jgi:hypothetical protein
MMRMTEVVSSSLMEQTWRAVASSSPERVRNLQKQCGKMQEELTGFVLGFTSDLGPEALGLTLYIHLVIVDAFRRSGVKFRRIRPGRIERTWAENGQFVQTLQAAGFGQSSFQVPPELSSEPAITQYIVDALTEKEDEPIVLSAEEFWHAFRVLKTVSDCFHNARHDRAA